jgi:hypothetical protein
LQVDVDESGNILGPFHVTAQPINRVGNSAQHVFISTKFHDLAVQADLQDISTQVSLLPPP